MKYALTSIITAQLLLLKLNRNYVQMVLTETVNAILCNNY